MRYRIRSFLFDSIRKRRFGTQNHLLPTAHYFLFFPINQKPFSSTNSITKLCRSVLLSSVSSRHFLIPFLFLPSFCHYFLNPFDLFSFSFGNSPNSFAFFCSIWSFPIILSSSFRSLLDIFFLHSSIYLPFFRLLRS